MTDIKIISHDATPTPRQHYSDQTMMGPERLFHTVTAKALADNFKDLLNSLSEALSIPEAVGSFKVDNLEVQLELTAEGQLGLLGTGGKLGGKGSLTLHLKR